MLCHADVFKQDHSVPVRAPPTEVSEVELDESSGHQTWTQASEEPKGQEESHPLSSSTASPLSL